MTIIEATQSCFRKYIQFSGRAPRAEFWKFILFIFLGMIACVVLNSIIFGPEISYLQKIDANVNPIGEVTALKQYTSGIFGNIFGLAVLLPWLSVTSRRMHDIGFKWFVPFLPPFLWILFCFLLLAITLGPNEFWRQISTTGQAHSQNGYGFFAAFLSFVLCICFNIYTLTRHSDPGPNKYGPNPTEVPS